MGAGRSFTRLHPQNVYIAIDPRHQVFCFLPHTCRARTHMNKTHTCMYMRARLILGPIDDLLFVELAKSQITRLWKRLESLGSGNRTSLIGAFNEDKPARLVLYSFLLNVHIEAHIFYS